jgi:molybdate transport system permease protein
MNASTVAAPSGAGLELGALWLTLELATITTVLLLLVGTPVAWWLSRTRAGIKPVIEALVALPLVLPPTVLGFYFLLVANPDAPLGRFWLEVTGDSLTFSFAGLVIASIVYSAPFMIQPLQTAFTSIGRGPLEAATMLRASPLDAFFTVVLPHAARGYLTATVLTFAHTVGEFGVVLMIGGNIPDETRVISIALYEAVETLDYASAHVMAALLLVFSFVVLAIVYAVDRRFARRVAAP